MSTEKTEPSTPVHAHCSLRFLEVDMTIEQMCRDLLEIAIRDGLVSESKQFDNPHPQVRTSGDLVAMANRLGFLFTQHARDKTREH